MSTGTSKPRLAVADSWLLQQETRIDSTLEKKLFLLESHQENSEISFSKLIFIKF